MSKDKQTDEQVNEDSNDWQPTAKEVEELRADVGEKTILVKYDDGHGSIFQ